MTTAEGTAAIKAALADFGADRATQTQLTGDETFDINADLAAKLVAALDTAWSD